MFRSELRKKIVFSILVVALVQGELATAAQAAQAAQSSQQRPRTMDQVQPNVSSLAPLNEPRKIEEAADVIRSAESRPLSLYVGGLSVKLTPDFLERFEKDLDQVLKANALVGFADDEEGFRSWWTQKKTEVLVARASMGANLTLQSFFAQAYLKFKVEKAIEANEVGGLTKWLEDVLNNDVVRHVTEPTFWITMGFLVSIGNIVKGATIAGPAGGLVSAFVEALVRPVREKFAIVGGRLFTKPGAFLTWLLHGEKEVKNSKTTVDNAKQSAKDMILLARSLGFDMTPAQYSENLGKIQAAWNDYNQVWLTKQPESFKTGRMMLTESWIFRFQHFSNAILNSTAVADTNRLLIDSTVDRIKANAPQAAVQIDPAAENLLKLMEERFVLEAHEGEKRAQLDAKIEASKQQLQQLGASMKQIERLVTSQNNVMISVRHAATSTAGYLLHEFQYEEMNRALPEELYKKYQFMREKFGMNFFSQVYAKEVVSTLQTLGIKVSILDKLQAEVEKAPAEKKAINKIEELNQRRESIKVNARLGNTWTGPNDRVKEAVGKAGRR